MKKYYLGRARPAARAAPRRSHPYQYLNLIGTYLAKFRILARYLGYCRTHAGTRILSEIL
eukprot:SAG31_NODE_598_length_13651_cov_10.681818_5_plen_60_part_00